MKPRIQLAVLFALLACTLAFPDTSVDHVNPPPSIKHADSHKEKQVGLVRGEANAAEKKESIPKAEVIQKIEKPLDDAPGNVQKVPKTDINSKPALPEEQIPVPAKQDEAVHHGKLHKRSDATSLETREIDGYVSFKSANAGMRLPPNQIRGVRKQGYGAYPYAYNRQQQERADKRKRPYQDKNKKKAGNKKRRTPSSSSSNNRKKNKKKVTPKPAPPKKPVTNNNRRGTPATNNNYNGNYNNYNNNQNNRRKGTQAPVKNNNRNKNKQPNRRNPNTRRKPTTARPVARRRKQSYRKRPSYKERMY